MNKEFFDIYSLICTKETMQISFQQRGFSKITQACLCIYKVLSSQQDLIHFEHLNASLLLPGYVTLQNYTISKIDYGL